MTTLPDEPFQDPEIIPGADPLSVPIQPGEPAQPGEDPGAVPEVEPEPV
jgi:hypothetical protein